MSWHHGRLVAFDCETDGVDINASRIATAAVVFVGGGLPIESRTWVIDTGREMPQEAGKVNGLTTEFLREHGRPPGAAVAEIVEMIATRPAGAPVVATNLRFDLTVLDREARRNGVVPLMDRGELLGVDPLVMAHRADSDALAAARLAWRIVHVGEVVREPRHYNYEQDSAERDAQREEWERVKGDLRLLHEAQRRWARERGESLRDYYREKLMHDKADGVDMEWPVVPVPEGWLANAVVQAGGAE